MAAKRAKSAGKARKTGGRKPARTGGFRPIAWLRRWVFRAVLVVIAATVALVALFRVVNPPVTHTIWVESARLGGVERDWVSMDAIAPVMARSAVAAEDANFCTHWGFDMEAIRAAVATGAQRGGSTISQQVVKNVFLWQGRSWLRKGLEAGLTPLVEALWPKRRILEVYLNVAEFDEGVFGVEAAAQAYFGIPASELSAAQAARLAMVLPNPKRRDAARPTGAMQRRAASIRDGAATIAADGRAVCFEQDGS